MSPLRQAIFSWLAWLPTSTGTVIPLHTRILSRWFAFIQFLLDAVDLLLWGVGFISEGWQRQLSMAAPKAWRCQTTKLWLSVQQYYFRVDVC